VWAGIAQSVQGLATGWTVRESNPGGGDIFQSYRLIQSGRGVKNPPPSKAEVKERAELYLYVLSGPSRPIIG
jgi:hypothetical protein